MMKTTRGQRVDTVFVLIIFCVFAVSVLMVLMFGATIYQNMTEISREEQDERTVLSYIRTKVRNNDEAGSVYVGDFQGLPALCYDEEFGGIAYRTVIYHYNGWVYELFSEAELDFHPQDGVPIMELGELRFDKLDRGLIKVSSGTKELLILPRGSSSYSWDDSGLYREVTPG